MDQVTDFGEQLAALYAALADADPAAAGPAASTASAAGGVAAAFADACGAEKERYLLRALDDAIAALEVAARLADEYHGTTRETPPDPADPLYSLYAEFAASQPALQALYHYRNALAARLGGITPLAVPSATPARADIEPPLPVPEETDQPG
jgi:hypothetical protein